MKEIVKGYSLVSSTRGFIGMYTSEAFAWADAKTLTPVLDWGTLIVKATKVLVASDECAECGADVIKSEQADHACDYRGI